MDEIHARLSREAERRGALGVLPRPGGSLCKVAIPLIVLFRERRLRGLRVEIRFCLTDGGLLQRLLALETVQSRLARLDNRRRAVGGGAKIAVVETDQRLARAHVFVVADEDLRHEAGDVRRDRGDIAAGVGVVGAFDEAPHPPVFRAVPGSSDGD